MQLRFTVDSAQTLRFLYTKSHTHTLQYTSTLTHTLAFYLPFLDEYTKTNTLTS